MLLLLVAHVFAGRVRDPWVSEKDMVEAARSGDVEAFEKHSHLSRFVLDRPCDGKTAMGEAAFFGHEELIRHLCKRGADPDATENDGHYTPLIWASHHGDAHIIRALCECGADVHARNVDDETPLIIASRKNHTESAAVLLEYGADPNAKDDKGETALMHAAWNGNNALINVLDGCGERAKTECEVS